ncbi:MAG: heparinase, partial [Pseudomonadota bacterium]
AAPATLAPLGTANGYQHLYVEGAGSAASGNTKFSWMNERRFYTVTAITDASDELMFTRIGANDPDFNLRREAGFMLRRDNTANTLFVSTVESHGSYNPVSELALNTESNIATLSVAYDDENYTAIAIESVSGGTSLFIVCNTDASAASSHELTVDGTVHAWTGPYLYLEAP